MGNANIYLANDCPAKKKAVCTLVDIGTGNRIADEFQGIYLRIQQAVPESEGTCITRLHLPGHDLTALPRSARSLI